MMLTKNLCVLYGCQNKQQRLPYTRLSLVFVTQFRVFTARYALSPYIKQTRFLFKRYSSSHLILSDEQPWKPKTSIIKVVSFLR
jgi:hypothetical protein